MMRSVSVPSAVSRITGTGLRSRSARQTARPSRPGNMMSSTTRSGESAAADSPDLVVLDIMLPGLDGLAVCRALRERSPVPVILLTALGTETDRIMGLEVGADDYLTKPFSPRELVLRVASVLRRARTAPPVPQGPKALVDGPLRLDIAAHEVEFGGDSLMLTVREFDL